MIDKNHWVLMINITTYGNEFCHILNSLSDIENRFERTGVNQHMETPLEVR